MADQTPKVATPLPAQNSSPMAVAQAGHMDAPVGIPAGPSMQEMMLQLQQQGHMIAGLHTMLLEAKARGFVPEDVAPEEIVEKTFYHQCPGSNIVVTDRGPAGEHIPRMVHFDHHGELVTKDPVVLQFLNAIVDRPGVPIYSRKAPYVDPAAKEAADQVKQAAARTIEKLGPEAAALKA